jgi:hypothetical protein
MPYASKWGVTGKREREGDGLSNNRTSAEMCLPIRSLKTDLHVRYVCLNITLVMFNRYVGFINKLWMAAQELEV